MSAECPTCEDLRRHLAKLKREVAYKDEVLHRKNLALGALRYVWCTGCPNGVRDGAEITEALVQAAEHQVARLRLWFTNRAFQQRQLSEGK